MFSFIITLIIVVALLLVLVVLAQNSKGGGMSSQFGGSSTSQLIGVKKTGDFLEKSTWTLAIVLLALTLSSNFFIDRSAPNQFTSPNVEKARETNIMPTLGQPAEDSSQNEIIAPVEDTTNNQ
ncbi:preprotein translocase subunit SecG [Xanthovirga aplysinae]|uniref:preprotein translocase subunit SecG n=1 Tax=Xanthovirga aplysinae TaxID=2529853 RepID=UPI0012BC9DD7|nr:preprotein translocase subunit SecG [Xanthovirga aplysinae]MTI31108.1 preprotein translocase subunit SecG [Xanthovirga aplysinae]